MSFLDRAAPFIDLGIPVFPLSPGTKIPPAGLRFLEEATTDPNKLNEWNEQNPDYNVAILARPDGFCFLEFDVKGGMDSAAQEAGQTIPATRTQKSAGKSCGHYIFRQTERTRSLGNRRANNPDGSEWFSFRQSNQYLCGAGSYLAEHDRSYITVADVPPIEMPDWLCDFVAKNGAAPKSKSSAADRIVAEDFDFDDFLSHYGIGIVAQETDWYVTEVCPIAGYRHENSRKTGFFYDGSHLGFHCFAQGCEGANMSIGAVIRHFNETHERYPKNIWPKQDDAELDVEWLQITAESQAPVATEPLPEAGAQPIPIEPETEQAQELKYPELLFPLDSIKPGRFRDLVEVAGEGGLAPGLIAPALLTLASSLPVYDAMEGARINSYCCLLALVGAGKDSAIDRSIATLGMRQGQFTTYTPSGERSLSNLLGDRPEKRGSENRIAGPKRHCIVTYEIEDSMAKSRGETSSLLQALQWFYDHNNKLFSDARSNSTQNVDCRLSWLTALPVGEGEIDEETFRRVFGEQASHGLVSRMWFGFSESRFDRRKSRNWTPPADVTGTSRVVIDGCEINVEETHSLFAQLTQARVEGFSPGIEQQYLTWMPEKDWTGRDTYHVIKLSILCAVLNGHKLIEQDDWDFAKSFVAWQGRIRETFSTGRATQVTAGQFHETVMREVEKRTAKLKKTRMADKHNKIVAWEGREFFYVRWKSMANAGRWYKYGQDVERVIDMLVRQGALAYLEETDGEKDTVNKRWVRLV